ncbi:transposase [Streptomyces sp. NPDC002888]|uniref:transposase n=1 Tax=Streptomyces sp. NPDC002888 TaxID=3364668 RepID=UPI00369862E3
MRTPSSDWCHTADGLNPAPRDKQLSQRFETLEAITRRRQHSRQNTAAARALYGGLSRWRIDVARLRRALASMPLPRAADGRIVLAADVSPWLRPDSNACPDRSFCHTIGRGEGKHQMVPGRPYSIVAALETGRTSWTAALDAVRLRPSADVAAVTTDQIREVVERIIAAGQWRSGRV